MACKKTNTQNNTKTRKTPWHNRHLDICVFRFICIEMEKLLKDCTNKLKMHIQMEICFIAQL